MRPVCAFSPCMPRPRRPGPSRAWRLRGTAFSHLIPGHRCSSLPQRPAVGPHELGRVGVLPGMWAWRRMPGVCCTVRAGLVACPSDSLPPWGLLLGFGKGARLLSGFVNWKTGKKCGWEQVEPEGEAGSEEEGRGGQAALREDGEELLCPRCPHWGQGAAKCVQGGATQGLRRSCFVVWSFWVRGQHPPPAAHSPGGMGTC